MVSCSASLMDARQPVTVALTRIVNASEKMRGKNLLLSALETEDSNLVNALFDLRPAHTDGV